MAGQLFDTDNLGGYLSLPELSRELRTVAEPSYRFRQFTKPIKAFGKGKHDIVYFDRVSNVATPGGPITESATVPKTNFTITQGSIQVTEYANSVDYTFKLETLSKIDVPQVVRDALRRDMVATLDKAAADAFKSTKIKYTPVGTTTTPEPAFDVDGVVSTAATRNIMAFDVKEIVEYMRGTLYVPAYDKDGFYICLCSPGFARALMDDPEWENVNMYNNGGENIYNGEIGRYWGVKFIETTGNLNSKISTNYKGEAVIFGADPVMEAVAVPEELRVKIPTDYGRDQGIAWYYLGGFGISWDTANAGECKIIHITGA